METDTAWSNLADLGVPILETAEPATVPARTRRTRAQMDDLRTIVVEVLSEANPMTVRQVYYQLVARHVIANNSSEYQLVSAQLVKMRRNGTIPWEWIEDRTRQPRRIGMWDDLADFAETVRRSYRRNVWPTQPRYVEIWLEKDALSGVFDEVRTYYGVTMNVGRGYDGWDSLRNAAQRYIKAPQPTTILYFGDFDPSGEDMVRSLRKRLNDLDVAPQIIKCALTMDDIERYDLPPDFAKVTDTRRDAFVAKHGDVSVELDALPLAVLRDRIRSEIETHMDLDALAAVKKLEAQEQERLNELVDLMAKAAL